MDPKLVYVKTPTGDEAVRQSIHVAQRNLRMVLVQVDGKLCVAEMAAKIGNSQLVESLLRELEAGGFIAPSMDVWEDGERQARVGRSSELSKSSTFSEESARFFETGNLAGVARSFSACGKPIFSHSRNVASEPAMVNRCDEPEIAQGKRMRLYFWFRRGVIGFVVLFGVLLGVAFFYPYSRLIPAFEASTSRFLQTPVLISDVGVTFSPWPQLTLSDVKLGESADSQIDTISIASPLSLLSGGLQRISSVKISGATISVNRIADLPLFAFRRELAVEDISIQEIRFTQSQVSVRDLALRDLSGVIRFKSNGSVDNASFYAVDRSIQFSAVPTAQGIALKIHGQGWKPAGSPFSFDSLQAEGLLQKDRLFIRSLDTTFLGGILKGTWLFDGGNGLMIAGDATLSRLDCRQIGAAFASSLKLQGDLSGALRLRAGGSDWQSMWENVEATLDAEITRGVLDGVDLGEAARHDGGSLVRVGSTKFERIQTTLMINPRQISGRDLQMSAGLMTASGQFVASRDGRVEANAMVSIHMSTLTRQVPVRISGVLPDLTVVGGSK